MKHAVFTLFIGIFAFTQVNAQFEMPQISPKPFWVAGTANCRQSLNGTWKIQTSTVRSSIEVPGELTMQGFDIPEGEIATYTRTFTISPDWQGKRIRIRFDAISSYGVVKVNGQKIGEHEGGMVPFEFDITKAVKAGTNELQVEVQSRTISDRLSCISQYAAHSVGGILRKVTLFAFPQTNIATMDAVTVLDKSFRQATLNLTTEIVFEGISDQGITIEYSLKDTQGKVVASQKQPVDTQGKVSGCLVVKNASLWTSETPYLYTLTTTLYKDNQPLQINEQSIGLRQVEIKGNRLLINGSPVKLHGVNRHEVHPLKGRSLTPELCRQDAELFRAGNCNYIRTSHYPPSEEFLDACDELGLFVECEATLCWIQHGASPIWKLWNYEDKKYLPFMLRVNFDNVSANRHHPSIIIWSLGNESKWSPLWEEVLTLVKKTDPSRPTSFHDQCWGGFNNAGSKADIANYHYPDMKGPAACDTMTRPTLFGEYAHLSCYNRTELVTDPGIRSSYGKPLQQMYDSMYYHKGCLGGAIWSGIDDIFHLPDGQVAGYGPWGPLDAWRRPKPEYTGMKKAYSPVRILDHKQTDKGFILTIENRYDFVNLDRVRFEYGSDENSSLKPVKFNLQPHAKGQIIIPTQDSFYFRVTDPRGFVCLEEKFQKTLFMPPVIRENTLPVFVDENDHSLHIRCLDSGKSEYTISKVTGLITHAVAKGKTVLSQGPAFCFVPMESDNGGKPNVANETYQNNIYPIKNYPLYTLYAKELKYSRSNDGFVVVDILAQYNSGEEGTLSYTFYGSGEVRLSYEIKVSGEISPRQYGMLFQLPRSMNTIQWERDGEFSHYPAYDIARTKGEARLNEQSVYEVEKWGVQPGGDWKEDANILGSTDFRSTKTQIKEVRLSDGNNGLFVESNGEQASRSWLQDGHIQLLIADYNNAGAEPFYGSPFTSDRATIKKDEVIKGSVTFSIY